MAFDFPNTPTTNQIATMPDGTVRRWDGIKWVAGQSPTAPYCFIGDTAPSSPTPGTTWWDSVSCQLFVYYNDGNSSQWVPAVAVPASIGEAPSNSNFYARQNGQWVNLGTSQLQGNVGRNLLHNSLFNIAQRGISGFTTSGILTLDRWRLWLASDTVSITQNQNSDAARSAIGDEAASVVLVNTFTGNAAAGAFNFITQAIEGTRRLSGKNVTVSFWAAALAGTPKLGINVQINYGSGGSPSTGIRVLSSGNSVTLSSAWTRYTTTIAIPSTVGKTLGTNNDDYTALEFWFSSGATSNASAGNIGVQSGTVLLWGVQLEIGTIATQLEKVDSRIDLANCQRFYANESFNIGGYSGVVSGMGLTTYPLPNKMRTTPSITLSSLGYGNCSALIVSYASSTFWAPQITVPTTGPFAVNGSFQASADL